LDFFRIADRFLKGNSIGIEKKSPSGEVLEIFAIEYPIWHIDDLTIVVHDFCIIECDFFYDPLDPLDTDRIPDLECFTHDDRHTSEEVGDDISTREDKYSSTDTRSCEESSGIDMEVLEEDKSSNDPYKKEYDKTKCRKKFSNKCMLMRKIVLNLSEDKSYDIREDRCPEKGKYARVDTIQECPS
jgi:hypothetical protein